VKTKAHHHWFLLAVAVVLVYHYRVQLLALWRTSIAPKLAAVLPPSVAAVIPGVTVPVTPPRVVPSVGGVGNPNLNLTPKDAGGIKSVGGDVNDQTFVGPTIGSFLASLGGYTGYTGGNGSERGGQPYNQGGVEHFE
jgi:hypothetical protein